MVTQVRANNADSSRLRVESKKRIVDASGSDPAVVVGMNGRWYYAPLARWFAAWRCECTDVELAPEDIPDRCPDHGERLIGKRELFQFGETIELGIGAP